MKNQKSISTLVISIGILINVTSLSAEQTERDSIHTLEKQVVTASRIPTTLSNTSRDITIIDHEEIMNSPAQTVVELLEYVSGVDVRQRGANGVQADIHMRGGTFEQTLILIDGIKMSDAQTGHHTMDLPVTLNDIDRIEILPGAASRLYGPNAFGGVINIITRKGHEKAIRLLQTAGEHGLSNTAVSLSAPIGPTGNRISIQKKVSTGFRDGTEFDITGFSYGFHLALEKTMQNILIGYLDKPFGAYSFYSTKFPDEWEHTKTFLMSSSGNYLFGNITLTHKLYWRRHFDDFILDRNDPSFYRNKHTTHSYGGEVQVNIPSPVGVTAVGIIANEERIASTNLGDHSRYYGGFLGEHLFTLKNRLTVTPGILYNYYKKWGWQFCPGVDVGFTIIKPLRIYSSIGRSFRIPSYTEYYYNSPANLGDSDLKPEESITLEGGIKFINKLISTNLCGFRRYGKNLIDWLENESGEQWQANALDVTTDGIEIEFCFFPRALVEKIPFTKALITYSYLDSDKDKGDATYSRYILNHLRHQLHSEIAYDILGRVDQTWRLKYEERVTGDERILVDSRLNIKIWQAILFLEVSNLFDVKYEDVGNVPMPGRWIKGGVNISLKGQK